MSRRRKLILVFLGIMVASIGARWISSPGYMDADYYYAMGKGLVSGEGLAEPFIWNYLSDPKGIPQPAFQYWMPFTSFLAALGQLLFGVGFRAAQIPFILLAASFPLFTAWIANRLHGDPQMAWESGLLAAAPGFFLPFFVTTDAFSIYGMIGSLIFVLSIEAYREGGYLRWLLTGLLIGIAHLTRTDGLLFLPLSVGLIFYARQGKKTALAGLMTGYLFVLLPWWIVNAVVHGRALSSGTIRVLWTLDYDDLFVYPPTILTFQRWINSGIGNILLVRINALWMNIKSLILVNGLVFLGPLMVIGARILRKNLMVRLASIYLLFLIIIMSVIFPFAGSRGGYFHSSVAVMPILWALAPLGLRRVVKFGARYRPWDILQATGFFTVATIILACLTTLGIFWSRVVGDDHLNPTWSASARVYQETARWFDQEGIRDSVVAVNNPPGFYNASGLEAVFIPDGDLDMLREVVDTYQVQWVLLDSNAPKGLQTIYENPQQVPWLEWVESMDDSQGKDLLIFEVLEKHK